MATDEQCLAAVRADVMDRIQGFKYGSVYVIRDMFKPRASDEIWRSETATAAEFHERCAMERMRVVLTAVGV